MPYTFDTILLSAQKTGNPPLIGTSLSGTAVSFLSGDSVVFREQNVVVVSLSTYDAGITFNPISVSVASNLLSSFKLNAYSVTNVTIKGSVFTIPSQMQNSEFAVVQVPVNNLRNYNVFTYLSSVATVPSSSISITTQVSNPNQRRLWHLGYI